MKPRRDCPAVAYRGPSHRHWCGKSAHHRGPHLCGHARCRFAWVKLGARVRLALVDQRGAEALEWLAVGALAVGAALVVYALPSGNVITGLNDLTFKVRLMLVGLVS